MSEGSIAPESAMGHEGGPASKLARQRIAVFFALALVAIATVAAASALLSLYGPNAGLPGTPLPLVTQPEKSDFCQTARLGGLVMERRGSELVFTKSGQIWQVTWPYGMAARLVEGKAELFAPSGIRIGREGEVLPDLGGGYGSDHRFYACGIGGVD